MEQLIIEIIDGHHNAYAEGTPEKPRWKQDAYLHNGGAFPEKCKLNLDGPQAAVPVGKYFVKPSGFRIGRYGDPELNNWELSKHLTPAPMDFKKSA